MSNKMALDALTDMLNGWRYIRSFHGDLYGVGWDRAEAKAVAAIAALQAEPQPALFRDLLTVAEGLHAWCKAVPEDTVLPAMPGLDGDFIQQTLEAARTATPPKD